MADRTILEVPVEGMDCAECTLHVRDAIARLPGVRAVDVFLGAEKAVIELDSAQVDMDSIREAVAGAGYQVPSPNDRKGNQTWAAGFTRQVLFLLGIIFGFVLLVMIAGEWLGLFEAISTRIPWYIGIMIVIFIGYPVFLNVFRAALKGKVIAHTLMTLGVLAAFVIGQWVTAAVVAFFMRVGDYTERFTAEKARRALRHLVELAPQTARVLRGDHEEELPIDEIHNGDIVIVRPGEVIPVDGSVVDGKAIVDQGAITGESLPVEAGPGSGVYAASHAYQGSIRVRVTGVGKDSTFGKVITQVEQAEAQRAEVQRIADKFSAYYLPVVTAVAALTLIIRRDPMATAAVLLVACSCAFALATPVAMLASIGAGAKRGLMIKGGKYIEILAKANVMLVDKTGTLTLGKPVISEIIVRRDRLPLTGSGEPDMEVSKNLILQYAASVERYSEHPLARAICDIANQRGLKAFEPHEFASITGKGAKAVVNGHPVVVGNLRLLLDEGIEVPADCIIDEREGASILYLGMDGDLVGWLVAVDRTRPEVPQAIEEVRKMGIKDILLISGDHEQTTAKLAGELGIRYRAELLPEDKIEIVRQYQSSGNTVIMVGDGINDAPALAQADVGIAMGAAGSDVAIEAAHIALLRDDWALIPEAIRISRRTMGVVKGNIWFTGIYNLIGITLAASGLLSPILAAAAQSIPDLGILANSSRLLRQK